MPEILKIADIYVIPSLFEGTSLSLLEAMFNGLPIIGSDARGINSMIVAGKNGVLFETGNATDLHTKVKTMLEHIDYYQHLGTQAAADYHLQWHHKHAIDEHLGIISQIAGGVTMPDISVPVIMYHSVGVRDQIMEFQLSYLPVPGF